ncbi:MAG: sulfurtransferase [bacterium]
MADRDRVLVDALTLKRELAGSSPPTLLDIRWRLGDPSAYARYQVAHLPHAIYVDLDRELAGPPNPAGGRHPLPELEDLQRAARRWGLRAGTSVVVYDDDGGLVAARAWWLLRWAGVNDVRLLDGGLDAWTAVGGDVFATAAELPTADGVLPQSGDVVLTPGRLPIVGPHDAAELARSGVLLDARAPERYRGDVEPVDARAGHIPGAVSAPATANLADGRLLDDAALRARYAGLGVEEGRPVGAYCGSGVNAALTVLALAAVGIPAALYPGSWSAWSGDDDRPVVTGAYPG